VAADALPFEYMLNALRLVDGFELTRFAERTGLSASVIEPTLARAQERGLIERDGPRVRASTRGFDFLSDLQAMFL
jgi:coproporphyrinogen III oxidase-like Fe-S oxidoreductase